MGSLLRHGTPDWESMHRCDERSAALGDGLEKVLRRVNALRYAGEPSVEWTATEEMLESLFQTSCRLAVYGTLAPGAPNHHVLGNVCGEWSQGDIHGDLHETGWGAEHGYPAVRWNPRSERVAVHLLESEHLARLWDRLDRFEGAGYQRILVPVFCGDTIIAIANIYEARPKRGSMSENDHRPAIRLERAVSAPIDRVFRALSEPGDLERWMWGSIGSDVRATVDVRKGGRYRISTSRPDGQTWAMTGTYTEVVPDRKIAFTVVWEAPMGYEPIDEAVTVELVERGGETTVVFRHDGAFEAKARDVHAQGWSDVLDTLKQHLEGE